MKPTENEFHLYRVIYEVLATQIRFGVYAAGDRLPRLEEANEHFLVSVDTLREAYLQLAKDGAVNLRKRAGATVRRQYSNAEIAAHIQDYFGRRSRSLPDATASLGDLFGKALWLGLKAASAAQLERVEALARDPKANSVHTVIQILQLLYGNLGNDLLMRLKWQIFMYHQAPFLSLGANVDFLRQHHSPILGMIALRRREDWSALRGAVDEFQNLFSSAVDRFYRQAVRGDSDDLPFQWNWHRSTSQFCYSLGLDLMTAITREEAPAKSKLPSLAQLAARYEVSVSTVRRTLILLNRLGAVATKNGSGTRVVSVAEAAAACDFAHPHVRECLVGVLQSLHFFSLTVRAVAERALAAAKKEDLCRLQQNLVDLMARNRSETALHACLQAFAEWAPQQTVREVYGSLLSLLYWGYPLRGLDGGSAGVEARRLANLEALSVSLAANNFSACAVRLEHMCLDEVRLTAARLQAKGVPGVDRLVI